MKWGTDSRSPNNNQSSQVTVLNRTFDRAYDLTRSYDGRIACENMEKLDNLILDVDMVFAPMNFDGYILKRSI